MKTFNVPESCCLETQMDEVEVEVENKPAAVPLTVVSSCLDPSGYGNHAGYSLAPLGSSRSSLVVYLEVGIALVLRLGTH